LVQEPNLSYTEHLKAQEEKERPQIKEDFEIKQKVKKRQVNLVR